MDTLNVVLKTGYKIVKDFSVQHKPVSNLAAHLSILMSSYKAYLALNKLAVHLKLFT